jgi:hypothetical protein
MVAGNARASEGLHRSTANLASRLRSSLQIRAPAKLVFPDLEIIKSKNGSDVRSHVFSTLRPSQVASRVWSALLAGIARSALPRAPSGLRSGHGLQPPKDGS